MDKPDPDFSQPEQPLWKDPKRLVEKRPYGDIGAAVLADKQV